LKLKHIESVASIIIKYMTVDNMSTGHIAELYRYAVSSVMFLCELLIVAQNLYIV